MKLQEKALVIMAAGLGSRYGGNKQVDKIGPDGEILMQYSIYDAIKSGFTKIVFIIKDLYDLGKLTFFGLADTAGDRAVFTYRVF